MANKIVFKPGDFVRVASDATEGNLYFNDSTEVAIEKGAWGIVKDVYYKTHIEENQFPRIQILTTQHIRDRYFKRCGLPSVWIDDYSLALLHTVPNYEKYATEYEINAIKDVMIGYE